MEQKEIKYNKTIKDIVKEVKKISGIEALLKEMSPVIKDINSKTYHLVERLRDMQRIFGLSNPNGYERGSYGSGHSLY